MDAKRTLVGGLLMSGRRPKSDWESLICGRMEAYLWGRASLFRSILAYISHSNKPPIGVRPSKPPDAPEDQRTRRSEADQPREEDRQQHDENDAVAHHAAAHH